MIFVTLNLHLQPMNTYHHSPKVAPSSSFAFYLERVSLVLLLNKGVNKVVNPISYGPICKNSFKYDFSFDLIPGDIDFYHCYYITDIQSGKTYSIS